MNNRIFTNFLMVIFVLTTSVVFVQRADAQTKKYYYWEVTIMLSEDRFPEFKAGDGETSICVFYSESGKPYKITEENSNTIYQLDFEGRDGEWKIYGTQFPLRKFWVNKHYILDVIYNFGRPTIAVRYNPKKGVVSGD